MKNQRRRGQMPIERPIGYEPEMSPEVTMVLSSCLSPHWVKVMLVLSWNGFTIISLGDTVSILQCIPIQSALSCNLIGQVS